MTIDLSVVDYQHGKLRCPQCRKLAGILAVLVDGRLACAKCVQKVLTER